MDEIQPKPPLGGIIPLHQATLEAPHECFACGLHRDHWSDKRQCWAKSAIEMSFKKLLVSPYPLTGNVTIVRENIAHWSDEHFKVHQIGAEFRLVSSCNQKATISASDALWLIEELKLGASMIATCETFAMAEKLGLDLQTFYNISSKASGQSWSMTSYCPVPGVGPTTPADNDYQGGFATALMLKDLKLAMEAAVSVNADVPMGERAAELYAQFDKAGNGGLDFSAIIKTLKDHA